MKELNAGDVYRHANSGALYTVKGVYPIKLNGVWIPNGAVEYCAEKDGGIYIRLFADFMRAFERQ